MALGLPALIRPPASLKARFALLLGVLTLTVALNAAVAAWAIFTLDRELAAPLQNVQRIMSALARAKRAIGEQHNLLTAAGRDQPAAIGPPASPADAPPPDPLALAPRFERLAGIADGALEELEGIDPFRVWAGPTTRQNLRARVDDAQAAARAWIATGDPDAYQQAARGLFDLHELIERIEGHVLSAAGEGAAFAGRLRTRLLFVIVSTLIIVVLASAYAANVIRRWVLLPVSRLRDAAERIAAGDFAHRIEIVGRDELALLSAEVNDMAATIDRMQRERIERERLAAVGEMVRRIVHNLRNPLAGIRSLAELSRDEAPPGSDLYESQTRIVRSLDRFESWLQSLLNVTKPLQPTLAPHDVAAWIRAVIDAQTPAAQAAGVSLQIHTPAPDLRAHFDPAHLEQAVVALVSNAIEVTPAGGTVRITASPDPGDGHWSITVSDQGPGVPPEHRDRLFTPYFTTKPTGSGIGLAMVKQVAEAHGGRVALRSAPEDPGKDHGSCFVLTLPIAPTVPSATDGQAGGNSGQNPGHRR